MPTQQSSTLPLGAGAREHTANCRRKSVCTQSICFTGTKVHILTQKAADAHLAQMREHRKQQSEAIISGESELARLRLENTQLEGQAAKMGYVETLLAQATSLYSVYSVYSVLYSVLYSGCGAAGAGDLSDSYKRTCFASTKVHILTAVGCSCWVPKIGNVFALWCVIICTFVPVKQVN